MAGRPEVDANELLYLKRIGMLMKDIVQILCVTLYNTIGQSGSPTIFATYTDPALDTAIRGTASKRL